MTFAVGVALNSLPSNKVGVKRDFKVNVQLALLMEVRIVARRFVFNGSKIARLAEILNKMLQTHKEVQPRPK